MTAPETIAFARYGEMGRLTAGRDWSDSPVGTIDSWPAELRGALGLMLPAEAQIVLFWGPDYVAFYNDAYAPTIGDKHPRALGRPAREHWAELWDDLEPLLRGVRETGETFIAKDRPFYIERHGYGEEVFFDISYSPVPDPTGQVAGILCIVAETTERVRAQRAQAEERARLAAMFEEAPGFMALVEGPDHVFTMANAAARRLIGESRVVVGRPLAEAMPEIEAQGFGVLLSQVRDSGDRYHGRGARVVLDPGTGPVDYDFDFVFQPVAFGDVSGVFIQGQDITEYKRLLDQAQEGEQRFRLIAESAPVMLWMSDVEGHCAYLNRGQRDFWGLGDEDLAAFDWGATIHPDDAQLLFEPYREGMQEQKGFAVEARYLRADGEYRLLHTDARPRFAPDGAFLGMVGVNVDITDIRTAQERLRQVNETLETKVATAIAERQQAEAALQQAQKMEAIGKLTGGVAHDFNNLLQVISGNLQLLEREVAGNEKAERRVASALAGVNRGAKLASQLLAFGRRQPLEPKVINVGKLVVATEEMLRRTLGEAIEIEAVVSGGLWNTLVDPTQIENALLNLAINARDAMDGTGKLTIEVQNAYLSADYARAQGDISAGQYVLLAISDTGCGMTQEVIGQVFEPFFSTKAEGKGTGLGLSMVYGFVKQSGGHIRLYSEPGQGTTVKLYLPRAYAEEDAIPASAPVPVGGGRETILIAEDDEEVRATAVEMLSELGYAVLTAKDAQSALAIIESGAAIDLLFTDVVMPGPVRSPEMVRLARQRRPDLAVLYTSGYTENAIVHGGRLDPGVELISKPYTRETLARRIRDVLAKRDGLG